MFSRIHSLLLFALGVSVALTSQSFAVPSITKLNLRGLQTGATTTLTIDGVDLLPSPRLVSSLPITSQALKDGATATRIQLDVTLDAKADPGLYNIWLTTEKGVSQRQIVAVDFLPQRPLTPKVESLPVAMHGNFTASRPVETTFVGKAGQKVIVEVESTRLGSKEQPVIHLLDAGGQEIGLALPSFVLHGDSRLTATLPSDSEYHVRIHDLQYAGTGAFRLKIGSWQYADAVFPLAVQRGKTTKLTLIGAPGSEKQVQCTPGDLPIMPAPWADAAESSGTRPLVLLSDIPELQEENAEKSPQVIKDVKPPFAISGRLSKPGEQDRFAIDVEPESTLQLSVVAAQIGSPVDAMLEVRDAKGTVLGANDDSPGSQDPRLELKVPKNVKSIVVAVKDAFARGSDASVYRLVVTPASDAPAASKDSGDFDLAVEDDTVTPTPDGNYVIKVAAKRRGYEGPIALRLADAPSGVQLQKDAQIPAGAEAALIPVVLKDGLDSTLSTIGHLIGEGRAGEKPLVRVANLQSYPLGDIQPWLRSEMLMAPVAKPEAAAFAVQFAEESESPEAIVGRKVALDVKCKRPVGFDGPVRLTLLTSQVPPFTRNTTTPDPARTLRPEQPKVEIPSDPKLMVAENTRLAAEKAMAAIKAAKGKPVDEAKLSAAADALAKAQAAAEKAAADAKNSAKVTLLVPPDLTAGSYDLAFKAELLTRDSTKVVATQFTTIRKLNAISSVTVQLDSEPLAEVKLDAKKGATAKWTGHITRLKEMTGAVTLVLEGLPKGLVAPKVVIPADKTEFKIDLKIPPTANISETAAIKLFATFKVDAKTTLLSRSPNVELSLKVEKGKEVGKVAK